jgi:hypothetical protein
MTLIVSAAGFDKTLPRARGCSPCFELFIQLETATRLRLACGIALAPSVSLMPVLIRSFWRFRRGKKRALEDARAAFRE